MPSVLSPYRATPGNYAVSLGGSGGWFTVVETGYTVVEGSGTTGGGLSTGGIIGIIAAAVGAGLGAFFATRHRQYWRSNPG